MATALKVILISYVRRERKSDSGQQIFFMRKTRKCVGEEVGGRRGAANDAKSGLSAADVYPVTGSATYDDRHRLRECLYSKICIVQWKQAADSQ